jgi:hypothetical protein
MRRTRASSLVFSRMMCVMATYRIPLPYSRPTQFGQSQSMHGPGVKWL